MSSSILRGLQSKGAMKRREFITLLGGAAATWPVAASAQQPDRMQRISMLMGYAEGDREGQAFVAAFREGVQKLGWKEGRNIRVDTRWAKPDDAELMQQYAKELVALQPDLILPHGTPTTATLLQQTQTIPIIFVNVSDPVGSGFVVNFPRPGGNVTGFTNIEPTMAGKWLELLKEIAPSVNRVAFLFNPATATYADYYLSSFKATAASFALDAIATPVRDTTELESAIASLAREPNGALIAICQISLRALIAWRLHCWRLVTVSLPSIRSVSSLKSVVCCLTEVNWSIIFGARRPMLIASSRARSRASFPSRPRSSSRW